MNTNIISKCLALTLTVSGMAAALTNTRADIPMNSGSAAGPYDDEFVYWDGGDAARWADGIVSGGNGVWRAAHASPFDTNWTNFTGFVNGEWQRGTCAVFGGASGTVTVDNSYGQVEFAGAKFLTDGYLITGGSLALSGNGAQLNIDSGVQATIASVITGSYGFDKVGGGTLTLTGNSTFGGDITVSAGVLNISGGELTTTQNLNVYGYDGALNVSGGLVKAVALSVESTNVQTISGGTVAVGFSYVGDHGVGSVVMNGGLWDNTGGITVGSMGDGTLTVTGGLVRAATLKVSYENKASVMISGGTVAVGNCNIGNITSGPASISMSGGLLDIIEHLTVGYGNCSLTVTGGTVSAGTAILADAPSYWGGVTTTVTVSGGLLRTTNNFYNGYSSYGNYYDTDGGASTLTVSGSGHVTVGGTYFQNANSTLRFDAAGRAVNDVFITAQSATVAGTLTVSGLNQSGGGVAKASDLADARQILLHTTDGITGAFTTGTVSGADYLVFNGQKSANHKDYFISAELAWNSDSARSHGNFTLAASETFEVDVALQNRTAHASWDGQSLNKRGGGTLLVTASQAYTGATIVSGGTLEVGYGGNVNSTSEVRVESGGAFIYNGGSTAPSLDRAVTVDGGKFSYNADANFSGTLIFNSGTLGGTNLRGMGTLSFSDANHILAPGNSIGTLLMDGAKFTSSGVLELEIGDAALNDKLIVDTLTLSDGGFTINVVNLGFNDFDAALDYSWEFITYGVLNGSVDSGAFTFNTDGFTGMDAAQLSVSDIGGKLIMSYSAVPEPSTWALMLTATLLLTALCHKRWSSTAKNYTMKTKLINQLAALFLSLALGASASAQLTNWNVADGDWNTPANWDGGLPVNTGTAYISNSGTAALLSGSGTAGRLVLGGAVAGGHLGVGGNAALQLDSLAAFGSAWPVTLTVTDRGGLNVSGLVEFNSSTLNLGGNGGLNAGQVRFSKSLYIIYGLCTVGRWQNDKAIPAI